MSNSPPKTDLKPKFKKYEKSTFGRASLNRKPHQAPKLEECEDFIMSSTDALNEVQTPLNDPYN